MPVTVDIPDVGTVDFPDGMPPAAIQAAAARIHAQHAGSASAANLSDTQDDAFRNVMMGTDDQIEGMKDWAPVVGGLVAGPIAGQVAGAAGPAVMKAAGSPVGSGLIAGGLNYAHTGSVVSAAKEALEYGLLNRLGGALIPGLSKGLSARLAALAAKAAPEIAAAAPIAQAAAPAVAEAAPAVAGAAYRGIPSLMKIAGTGAEDAAAAASAAQAAQAARGASLISKAATIGPAVAEAAPAAGKVAATVAEATPEAESELAAQLRASLKPADQVAAARAARLAKVAQITTATAKVPSAGAPVQATAFEIEKSVLALKGAGGLSDAQVVKSLREMYGVPPSYAKKMIEMISQTHGLK